MRRNQLFSRASASWRQLHFPALGFGRVFISDWLLVCSVVLSFGNDSRYSTLWREKSFIKCRDVFFFSGHLVLDGRVRQDTNGLGEVMDARVWPSLQRQTDRWERHGELWQNSGRHHQESIRGLCFPLRNLFQQQSLPWLQRLLLHGAEKKGEWKQMDPQYLHTPPLSIWDRGLSWQFHTNHCIFPT